MCKNPPISAWSSNVGRPEMPEYFDFVIVGGGSAGAVIASRLS
jgi:glycerol-3-phosphate dehydrogenase